MAGTLVGLFDDEAAAQQAAQELLRWGVARDDIGIVTGDTDGVSPGGRIAAEGQHSVPGVLPGGVVGGITAALTRGGIGPDEARGFAEAVAGGGALVTVDAQGTDAERIRAFLRSSAAASNDTAFHGTPDTQTPDIGTPAAPASGADTSRTMELYGEELRVSKDQVQTGEVTLRKEVITEMRTIEVPVTREEVVIERHAASGAAGATDAGFGASEEVIRIPVMEEQVTVGKTAVVTEEVTLGTRQVTETEHVMDTVRHEEARVENPAGVDVLERGNKTA